MASVGGALSGAAGGALSGLAYGPLGALAGGAIGGIAGLFGGGKSKLQKGLENKVLPVTDNLLTWSGQANDARKVLQGLGTKDLAKASGFYEGILDPNDVTAFNSLVGPQRTAINAGYENAKNNLARGIGPGGGARGGGRASGLMNFEFQKNKEMMELVPQARMMAAAGLSNVGGQANQSAIGFGDLALNNSQSILSAAGVMQPNLNQQATQRGASYASLGQQIGQLLGPYLQSAGKKPGAGVGGKLSEITTGG